MFKLHLSVSSVFAFFQELNLAEAAVNRLQMVGLRFCGVADQALPRLRGALPAGMLSFTFILDETCKWCLGTYLILLVPSHCR